MIKGYNQFINENYEVEEGAGLGSNAKPDTQNFEVSARVDAGDTFEVGKSQINTGSASYKAAVNQLKAAANFAKGLPGTSKVGIVVNGGASAIPFKNSTPAESIEKNKKLANDRANAFVAAAKSDLGSLADKINFTVGDPLLGTHTSGAEAQAEQFVKVHSIDRKTGSSAIDTTSTAAASAKAAQTRLGLNIPYTEVKFIIPTYYVGTPEYAEVIKGLAKLSARNFNKKDLPVGQLTADTGTQSNQDGLPDQDQVA